MWSCGYSKVLREAFEPLHVLLLVSDQEEGSACMQKALCAADQEAEGLIKNNFILKNQKSIYCCRRQNI